MNLSLINPKYYLIEFKKFLSYVIKPTYIEASRGTTLQKIKGTWSIFVIKTILTIVIGILVTLIYDPVNKTTVRWNEEFSTLTIFFLSIIILPLLEEVAFRLSLKFKPIYLSLTLSVLSYYFMTKAIYQTNLSNIDYHFISRLLVTITILVISYPIFSHKSIRNRFENFWQKNFKWIFYFLCFTFAAMHILNYGVTLIHMLLLPLITLPKLISAISYGYIRMHYGFFYSLGLHMCWNSIGFIMSLFPSISSDLIF